VSASGGLGIDPGTYGPSQASKEEAGGVEGAMSIFFPDEKRNPGEFDR
jgi:hypothetical protein